MTEIRWPYPMAPNCAEGRHDECTWHAEIGKDICLCDCHRDDLPLCRSCKTRGMREVLVLHRQGVPDGYPDHTMVYCHWVYRVCARCGQGELEYRDHDCFGAPNDPDEPWDLDDYYPLPPAEAAWLMALIREICPQPLEPECACDLHESLRASLAALPHTGYRTGSRVHPVTLNPPAESVRFVPQPPALAT